MKKAQSLIALIALICSAMFVVSCKKDNTNLDPAPIVYAKYYPLKVGNYWVYQRFDIDTSGNATPTSTYDSCYVEKDTLINSIKYYKVIRPGSAVGSLKIYYLNNFNHYVLDSAQKVYFSSEDFTTIFKDYYIFGGSTTDTISHVTEKMADKDQMVSTPAGEFQTSNYKINYVIYPNWVSFFSQRALNTRYAKDVGIVTETLPIYLSQPNYFERRLVRFHLN